MIVSLPKEDLFSSSWKKEKETPEKRKQRHLKGDADEATRETPALPCPALPCGQWPTRKTKRRMFSKQTSRFKYPIIIALRNCRADRFKFIYRTFVYKYSFGAAKKKRTRETYLSATLEKSKIYFKMLRTSHLLREVREGKDFRKNEGRCGTVSNDKRIRSQAKVEKDKEQFGVVRNSKSSDERGVANKFFFCRTSFSDRQRTE